MALKLEVALVNGSVGLVLAPGGRVARVIHVTVANGTVTEVEVIADPARLHALELAALD